MKTDMIFEICHPEQRKGAMGGITFAAVDDDVASLDTFALLRMTDSSNLFL